MTFNKSFIDSKETVVQGEAVQLASGKFIIYLFVLFMFFLLVVTCVASNKSTTLKK